MLWSLRVRKVRLWNKRHAKKVKHYYLWSSVKYKNIPTDNSCILSGFFYNLGYLWSLRVAISILFRNVLLCKDILAGKGTGRNLWDESAPAAAAPNLAGGFLQRKFQPSLQYLVQKCASIFQNPTRKFGQPGAVERKKRNYCNMNWIIMSG